MHAILPVLSITLLSSGGLRSAKANGTGSVSAMRVCPKAGVVQVVRKSISADFDDEPNKVILEQRSALPQNRWCVRDTGTCSAALQGGKCGGPQRNSSLRRNK